MTGPNPRPDQKRGKTKQDSSPKTHNRGGGRPPNEISNEVIDAFIECLNDQEKEHGTSWIMEFTSLMWGKDKSAKIRVGKELAKMFTVQHTSKDVQINDIREPSIGLPPQEADPAKVVSIK